MPHRLSLFSQRLDRVVYVAYFLGAVVPLGALAIVVREATLGATRPTAHLVAFVASTAILTLASFLALRRTTRRALASMDEDAHRLTTLLNASTALTTAADGAAAASIAATYAARITGARAAFVVSKSDVPGRFEWSASVGADAGCLVRSHSPEIEKLAQGVVEGGRATMRRPGHDGTTDWAGPTTVAVPFVTDAGLAVAALVVMHGDDDGLFEPKQLDGLLTLAGLASVALANAELRRTIERKRTTSPTSAQAHAQAEAEELIGACVP